MWNTRGPLAGVGLCLLASSCAQGDAPTGGDQDRQGAGLYVLRSVAGYPPPVVANEVATLVVIADTIRLGSDGTGSESGVELLVDNTLPEGGLKQGYEREFNYRRTGHRIEVEFPCPPNALMLCIAPPHYVGTFTAGGLEFSFALYYRTPLVFERVGD
jgi:hypothetical protein